MFRDHTNEEITIYVQTYSVQKYKDNTEAIQLHI